MGISHFCAAQFYEYINFGVKAGANYSMINEVPEIISLTTSQETVAFETEPQYGGIFGVFLHFRHQSAPISFQSELLYSMEHSQTKQYINNQHAFTLNFKYNYLQFNTLINFYPIQDNGYNLGMGPQIGWNLTPDNIEFKDIQYPNRELALQQQIRSAIYGTTNFQLLFNMGYEFRFGLYADARYLLGLADVMRTDPNTLNWEETRNTTSSFQFTLGYAFGVSTY